MNIALEELIKSYDLKIKQCYARQEQITTKDYNKSYYDILEELDEMVDSAYNMNECYDRALIHDYARVVEEYEQLLKQMDMLCAVIRDLQNLKYSVE